jgi:hypothetical protein
MGNIMSYRANTIISEEQVAYIVSQVDVSTKVDKVTGEALLAITEAAKIHLPGSDNQDLSGKADLVGGTVPANQLPSYVDDVLEYTNLAGFPVTGENGKIYIALDTNLTYRWTGSVYGVLDPSLALGETSTTAYRGDRGKTAYDHSQVAHAPSNAVTLSTVKADTDVSSAISLKHSNSNDHALHADDQDLSALTNASFYPVTMTVDTGTLNTGVVAGLQAVGGTDVDITEASGADPLRVHFNFTAVTRMTGFDFFGYYAGGSGHQIAIEIYNTITTNWDSLGLIGSDTAKGWYSFPIFNTSTYVSAGAVSVRFRHIQSGSITHHLYLDYLEINYGSAGGQSSISAAAIDFTPIGGIAATNVAAAIAELDTEKASVLGSDDNYVTDAEKVVIGNTSGTNSGDNSANSLYSGLASSKENIGVAASAVSAHAAVITGVHGLAITTAKVITATENTTLGGGSHSGTNTGDGAVNALYSGLAASKQDTLVSTTNIKSINGASILGAGNLVVSGALPDMVVYKNSVAIDTTIPTGYSAIVSDMFPIKGTAKLILQGTSTFYIKT